MQTLHTYTDITYKLPCNKPISFTLQCNNHSRTCTAFTLEFVNLTPLHYNITTTTTQCTWNLVSQPTDGNKLCYSTTNYFTIYPWFMILLQYLGKFNKFTFQTYAVNHLSNNHWTLYNSNDLQSWVYQTVINSSNTWLSAYSSLCYSKTKQLPHRLNTWMLIQVFLHL